MIIFFTLWQRWMAKGMTRRLRMYRRDGVR